MDEALTRSKQDVHTKGCLNRNRGAQPSNFNYCSHLGHTSIGLGSGNFD